MQLFYSNPNRSFYVREITRKIDEQINSVRRELANLLNIGIIVSDTTNNRLYYEVNQEFEHYKPLREIFGNSGQAAPTTTKSATKEKVDKSAPQTDADKIKGLGNVELAIYTGQFTRDEASGVDLLVVGEVNQNALNKFVANLEIQEGKDVRYALMTEKEFSYRRQINDRFITKVLESKKQILVDKNNIL